MRFLVTALLAAYGAGHVAVLVRAWRAPPAAPVRRRVVGFLWLVTAGAFAAAAVGAAAMTGWWPALSGAAAASSLLLCLRAWPGFRVGIALDVAMLVAVVLGLGRAGGARDHLTSEEPVSCWSRPASPLP